MPPILNLKSVSKSYATRILFSDLNLFLESGEKIGLIGPNGAGKSTLLKIMADKISPDKGERTVQRGLKIGYLEQVPRFSKNSTVLSTILESSHHEDSNDSLALAYELVSKLGLESGEKISPESLVETLSGGWKKRVALARELMREPDLLLLDEPTNHLDVESILWMENFLQGSSFTSVTITHDRYFLQKVAKRILELDRRNPGGLLSVKGNYADYLDAKEELLKNQEKLEQSLRNTLRREQEWLRQGVKARGTKQQARIQRAGLLAEQVEDIRNRNIFKSADIEFQVEGHHPKKLLEAKHLEKSLESRCLFKDFNLLLSPGSRVAFLGPNGCGKSTLLKVLLKQQKADQGTVFHSEALQVAYFEQNRESLDPEQSLIKAIAPHGDQVIYQGNPIHARAYLDRFLFTNAQMNMKVGQLSGGEQSRLLIARLMLQEANLLVLDEPTNDLDLETLAVLEDCLTSFEGAVLLVSHDRFFVDRVATQILAFDPFDAGKIESFASLDQWERWHQEQLKKIEVKISPSKIKTQKEVTPSKKKLSYKERLEWESMEEKIQKAESELANFEAQLQVPETVSDSTKLLEISKQMQNLQIQIDQLYARWVELEAKQDK